MKRDRRPICLITDPDRWGPRLAAQLRAGEVVDVAGCRLKLKGVEPTQVALELS